MWFATVPLGEKSTASPAVRVPITVEIPGFWSLEAPCVEYHRCVFTTSLTTATFGAPISPHVRMQSNDSVNGATMQSYNHHHMAPPA